MQAIEAVSGSNDVPVKAFYNDPKAEIQLLLQQRNGVTAGTGEEGQAQADGGVLWLRHQVDSVLEVILASLLVRSDLNRVLGYYPAELQGADPRASLVDLDFRSEEFAVEGEVEALGLRVRVEGPIGLR